jgi:putative ABC transport system permease protein
VFARLVLASLAARRLRLALALLAVGLGVGVATALGALALQIGDDLARTLRAAGPNFVLLPAGERLPLDLAGAMLPPPRVGGRLPVGSVADLKRSFWRNNLLEAAPELTVTAFRDGRPFPLTGTWFDRELEVEGGWRTGLEHLRPHWQVEGRWPREGSSEIALGRVLATRARLAPGAWITVTCGPSEELMLVTGVVDAGGADDARAWAPLERVQALSGHAEGVDRVWMSALLKPAPRRPAPDPRRDRAGYERWICTAYPGNVARELSARFPGSEALPLAEVVGGEARVVGRLDALMLALALATLAACTLGLLSTTTATVVERRVELALLRSLGATPRQLAALLLGETLLVAVAGGVLGWALGAVTAGAIRSEAFGGNAELPTALLPFALLLALAVGIAGTWGPLKIALRLDPAAVLRGQG